MKIAGFTAEFNPFHEGHKYFADKIREKTNADAVICTMSGNFAQRGDVTVFDKHLRAKSAVLCGINLVCELPVCCVLQSADNFALSSVSILKNLGADIIAFGCECDDLSLMKEIAKIRLFEPIEYKNVLAKELSLGKGYPSACESALRKCIKDLPDEVFMPNSTLAVSYIKAAMQLDFECEFCPIERVGSYHSTDTDVPYPSASAIREAIKSSGYQNALCSSDEIYDINALTPLILGFFRMAKSENLNGITGMEEGLANRMIEAAKKACTLDEFFTLCSSRRYTLHRVRRAALCALFDIRGFKMPEYARILALDKIGAAALNGVSKDFALITKAADFSYTKGDMFSKDILSSDIAALCCGKKAGRDFTTPPFVL